MSIDLKTCSEEELWKYIATELARNDIEVILVGGAVVSIYSEGAYKSGDLDFVINDFSRKKLGEVLGKLGFIQNGRHFKHPECTHLFIEFATFPVSIGDDYNITPDEVRNEDQIIKIFSPTDCVRDRLASFAYFEARECLDQAVMVSKKHAVNFDKIKKWCVDESIEATYDEYLIELKKN